MRIVLLGGGSGKRLWPLSNEIRSKIFLKLLPSKDGGMESMIQRICRQLGEAGFLSHTSIVAHQSQAEIMQNHIGDEVLFLAEPHRRGTFTAVALAVTYLHAKLQAAPNETICVIPADLFAESDFFSLLSRFPEILKQSGSELALLGTTPSHPSSQFGYIVPAPHQDPADKDYLEVAHFVEKPDEETALRLIGSQAMWNCGVFAFPLSFMLTGLQSRGLPTDYDELLACYEQLPEASFDVEIVEKTQPVVVLPFRNMWKDLGDWSVLPNYFGSSVVGLGEISSDCVHTHLVNELAYPIHVLGVSNIIVAASADGILVANKDKSNQIKKLRSSRQQPMYGEKRWGTYRVLDQSKTGGGLLETLTKKVELLPGKHTSYHSHQKRQEIWTIISGQGEFILEGVSTAIQTGDVLQIAAGAKHAIKAITPLEYIEIQIGTELVEADIMRLVVTWEEIIRYCSNG
ncbi:sugar phosphate nucleotidyltransferase [Paenibacillus sp. CF384]|uniref:sugar phosphate nucleotidyltransferase n=1 Tax=Paenibacillus sp. CF384 TaxID=1884382 RepID=UPI00089CF85E|nr:sugar phosphate nucleotidyltransferase [Paenibacillus sp. CF384]SDX80666.1 mannose-1-phosphate guanylyltransferase [Paenibacillus sp. CF384]